MDSAKFCEFCGSKFHQEEPIAEQDNKTVSQYTSNEAPPLPETPVNVSPGYGDDYTSLPPNNGLVWLIISSILTFLGCCCMGVGLLQVPTIITSAISVSRYKKGEYESAKNMAKTSMILFFSLLALMIIIIVIVLLTQDMSGFDYNDFSDFAEGYY
jgi:Trk-type K+ transport system membrane component